MIKKIVIDNAKTYWWLFVATFNTTAYVINEWIVNLVLGCMSFIIVGLYIKESFDKIIKEFKNNEQRWIECIY